MPTLAFPVSTVQGIDQLDALRTDLAAAVMKAFNETLNPTQRTPVGSFDTAECTFTGYASSTLGAWTPVGVNAAGQPYMESAQASFQAGDPLTVPGQMGGVWLEKAGGDLVGYAKFNAPVNISVAGQLVTARINWNGVSGPTVEVTY